MTADPPRAVFDAVVFVQALISGRGPAAACVEHAMCGDVLLFLSDATLAEMAEVPLRPELTRRYSHLTAERVAAFVGAIRSVAVHITSPAKAFALPRDPKDEPYTDLAIEGRDFCGRFPRLRILPPPDFLREISGSAPKPTI